MFKSLFLFCQDLKIHPDFECQPTMNWILNFEAWLFFSDAVSKLSNQTGLQPFDCYNAHAPHGLHRQMSLFSLFFLPIHFCLKAYEASFCFRQNRAILIEIFEYHEPVTLKVYSAYLWQCSCCAFWQFAPPLAKIAWTVGTQK